MPSQKEVLLKIKHVLEDMKAQNILELDVRELTSIADYMFIATGRSSRHVSSIAEELAMQLKQIHLDYLKLSGIQQGEWALIDCGDILIHVMQPEIRSYYNLEELWMKSAKSNHA